MNALQIKPAREFNRLFCLVALLLSVAGTAWAALPPGWSEADIGSPGLAGSASYAGGVWTVTGGGSDIWNNADQFHFASTNFTGDGEMIARVTSLQNSDPGSGWSKAGLMFRNDSTAGSANVTIVATAGQGVSFQWRSAAGGSSSYSAQSGIAAPVWLKLTRTGSSFTGSYSTDGNNWVQVRNQAVALSNAVMAGFDVTAHNNSALNTATYTDFSLVSTTNTPPTPGTNAPVTIALNALADRHPISPFVYGLNWASASELLGLNFPINRGGGNANTRYNWLHNCSNRASDWYFESLSDGSATPGASADTFITNTRDGAAEPMITIPIMGWMPKLGPNREDRYSFSVAKYGAQTATDPWRSDAGNGVSAATGLNITNNDPNDAHFYTNSVFQEGWVRHLTNRWGVSTNGGVKFYIMDNELTIWAWTHRDVHPIGATMEELRDKVIEYGGMVKSIDPNALICMGEEWGWNGFLNSGYDLQNPGNTDRNAHGGWDFMPWLLKEMRLNDLATGRKTIDYFTVHWYPQEPDFDSTTEAACLLRNRVTRALWDTNYVDESWINAKIYMVPRMKSWVASNYPGLKIGITEYVYGAVNHINGAIAQADTFGIFGREGLDLSTRWGLPDPSTPTYKAMKMYRNYDGSNSVFGDVSVRTAVPQPDYLSAFGAVRTSDGALTLMVLNKDLTNATPIVAGLTNFPAAGTAQRWQLTSANVITHLADLAVSNGVLRDMLPAQSITLFVLPPTNSFTLQVAGNSPPGQLGIWLHGQAGQTYYLQSSTDLVYWSHVATNLFESNSFEFFMPMTNSVQQYFRGRLGP